MNFTKNKQYLLLVSFGLILALIVFALIFLIVRDFNISPQLNPSRPIPLTPVPPENTTDFDENYSNLNFIEPGKSTLEDVVRINGEPDSSKTLSGGKTYFYITPNTSLANEVYIKNNVVEYATEHVFTNNRGTYDEYVDLYGPPHINLYNKGSGPAGLTWSVFLNDGVAIENNERDIATVLYFIPQNQEDFINRFSGILGLTLTPPEPVNHDIDPLLLNQVTPEP